MKKMVLMTLGVWAAALGSTAALAYTLNCPPHPVGTLDEVLGVKTAAALARAPSVAPLSLPPEEAVQLTPLVILGRVHRARPPRDLTAMRCSNWRELTQGPIDKRVRYCE